MTQNAINNTASTLTVGNASSTNYISQLRSASGQWLSWNDSTDTFGLYNRAGTPEGNITADIGTLCIDTTNGVLYIKQTDSANTGWTSVGGASGAVLQSVSSSTTSVVTTTSTIPADNTIPQITEGASALTVAITPADSTNVLFVETWGRSDPGATNIIGALFKQGTANSFVAAFINASYYLAGTVVAGSTSSQTLEFRIGSQAGTTVAVNGTTAGTHFWGAAGLMYLRVTELLP